MAGGQRRQDRPGDAHRRQFTRGARDGPRSLPAARTDLPEEVIAARPAPNLIVCRRVSRRFVPEADRRLGRRGPDRGVFVSVSQAVSTSPARIFLSYKRNVEPDQTLAHALV